MNSCHGPVHRSRRRLRDDEEGLVRCKAQTSDFGSRYGHDQRHLMGAESNFISTMFISIPTNVGLKSPELTLSSTFLFDSQAREKTN